MTSSSVAASPEAQQPDDYALVDVVVVSFNSRERLRRCLEPLAGQHGLEIVVVDNASTDGSLDAVANLPVKRVQQATNRGFAHGCNTGWRVGCASYVLFLNPDAFIDVTAVRRLVETIESDDHVTVAAPNVAGPDGSLGFSQRRFPRISSTFARAVFLHRLFPRAHWADEVVRDPATYDVPGTPEWVSGACMLVRRRALEMLNGFDEGFFMYCEDKDLCRRLRDAGGEIRYEPGALCVHEGGASAPRATLLATLATSRVRYARLHQTRATAALERIGIALEALLRVVASRGGAARIGHASAFAAVALPRREARYVPQAE